MATLVLPTLACISVYSLFCAISISLNKDWQCWVWKRRCRINVEISNRTGPILRLFWGPGGECLVICTYFFFSFLLQVLIFERKGCKPVFLLLFGCFELNAKIMHTFVGVGRRYCTKPFVSVPYCAFWMHKLQFGLFQGHIILLPSRPKHARWWFAFHPVCW